MDRGAVVAGSLMRMALALLDRAGEGLAAARLQHALDTLERRPPGVPTDADLARLARDDDADAVADVRDSGRSDQSGRPS